MRFTDNPLQSVNDMLGTDIVAGTDVDANADKKFSLSNLGEWITTKLALTLAGKSQTIQSAINSLNADLAKISYGTGTMITENTDLNTLSSPGVYNCQNAAIGQTLKNCPLAVAFRLEVKLTAGPTRYVQLFYPNVGSNPRFFIRIYTGEWSEWRAISCTAV